MCHVCSERLANSPFALFWSSKCCLWISAVLLIGSLPLSSPGTYIIWLICTPLSLPLSWPPLLSRCHRCSCVQVPTSLLFPRLVVFFLVLLPDCVAPVLGAVQICFCVFSGRLDRSLIVYADCVPVGPFLNQHLKAHHCSKQLSFEYGVLVRVLSCYSLLHSSSV